MKNRQPRPGTVRSLPASCQAAGHSRNVRVCLVSANVRTLLPWQEDRSYAQNSLCLLRSKVEALEVQFEAAGYDIVGIQEGRARSTASSDGVHYKMLAVAADPNGTAGNQLWIRNSLRATLVTWRDINPRIMYAIVELPNHHVIAVIVYHAHHMGAEEGTKASLYEDMWRTLNEVRSKFPYASVRLLTDANGRVGSVLSAAVGDMDKEKENDGGLRMRLMCEHFHLSLYNSFFKAGQTWTSTRGTRHRIDYVAGDALDLSKVSACYVDHEVDISLNDSIDHYPVVVRQSFSPKGENNDIVKMKPFQINKRNLNDPHCVEHFQQLMWAYTPPNGTDVDEHLEHLNGYVRSAAMRSFGPPTSEPRKRWISAETWSIISKVAPARREMHRVRQLKPAVIIRGAFMNWVAAAKSCGRLSSCSVSRWVAAGMASDSEAEARIITATVARWFRWIKMLQKMASPSLEADRQDFLATTAFKLECAMEDNDHRTAYGLARALGAKKSGVNTAVRKPNGELTTSRAEETERWEQHHADVFKGKFTSRDELRNIASLKRSTNTRKEYEQSAASTPILDVGPVATEAAYAKLANNKGVGPDAIPGELLRVGGGPVAVAYGNLNVRISHGEGWPVAWQGGEIVNIFKRKGDPADCDSHRGILLEDHAAKGGIKALMKADIDTQYNDKIPADQYGATRGRGTDFATHIITSIAAVAKIMEWSIFILFIDLTKAFDRIIRELIVGWPVLLASEKAQYLTSLGVCPESAEWMTRYIDSRGCVFRQWHVRENTTLLTRDMHDGAWMKVRGGNRCITSTTGGRQGCKLGATMFNAGYAVALDMMHWRLAQEKITLKLAVPKNGAFFSSYGTPDQEYTDVVDATFVDDECIAIVGTTPRVLERAIDVLLDIVTTIFRMLHLNINFGPNKTEAILLYRGKFATQCREKLRRADGALAIPLDRFGHAGAFLRIVRCYKHLGTYIDALGVTHGNVIERAKLALGAYSPIAMKVFGSPLISTSYKMCFLKTLVMSKQNFNVHLMIPSAKDIKKLNSTYMRGLRRIAGEMRYDNNDKGKSDLQVRWQMGAPSIDCILLTARVRYIIRIVREQPKTLCAVLHFRREHQRLPWTEQAIEDMLYVASRAENAPSTHPASQPNEWTVWLTNGDALHALHNIKFAESIIDKTKPIDGTTAPVATGYRCRPCEASFATKKALNLHRRIVHNFRAPWASRVDGSVCHACGKDFHTRVRCLNHLGDTRRPKCAEWILAHQPQLHEKTLAKLNATDATERKNARRAGHTTSLASRPPIQIGVSNV